MDMKRRALTVSVVVLSLLAMGYPQSAQQSGITQTPVARDQKVSRRTKGNPPTPSTKRQTLQKPQDPEAIALFIHLIDRYARNVSDKTDLDRRIEQELSKRPGSREAAVRMTANFKRLPITDRRAMLGKWADISVETKITSMQYRTAFERLANSARKPQPAIRQDQHSVAPRSNVSGKHSRPGSPTKTVRVPGSRPNRPATNANRPSVRSVLPILRQPRFNRTVPASAVANPVLQQDRFALRYEGMWCHSETDVDALLDGPNNDEIYVVTQVIDSRGNDWTTTHPRPHDPEWYEDVNDNDYRRGPRRRCWGGADGRAAEDLTLIIAAFEHDGGDPGEVARLFVEGLAFLQAVCAAALFTGGPVVWLACEGIGLLFVGLISGAMVIFTGGEDDPLSVETVVIGANQIRDWGGDPPASSRRGNIPYHFMTIHNGYGGSAGADYHLYFSVVRTGG